MQWNKRKWFIGVLVLVILILGAMVIYSYVAKPILSKYEINAQNQGVEFAVLSIMQQAASCQEVPLIFGNQTMNLIWVECPNRQVPAEQ